MTFRLSFHYIIPTLQSEAGDTNSTSTDRRGGLLAVTASYSKYAFSSRYSLPIVVLYVVFCCFLCRTNSVR